MTVTGGYLDNFVPTAGNAMQQNKKRRSAAGQINEQLRHIRPDHRFHPTFQCVEQRQCNNNHHGQMFAGAEHHTQNDRDGRDAHTFCESPA